MKREGLGLFLPLSFSQHTSNIDLGLVGKVRLKKLGVLELLAESCALLGRKGRWPFRNSPLLFSLREAPDKIRIVMLASCGWLWRAAWRHGDGDGNSVEC